MPSKITLRPNPEAKPIMEIDGQRVELDNVMCIEIQGGRPMVMTLWVTELDLEVEVSDRTAELALETIGHRRMAVLTDAEVGALGALLAFVNGQEVTAEARGHITRDGDRRGDALVRIVEGLDRNRTGINALQKVMRIIGERKNPLR